MKKILSLVLVLSMVLGSFAFAFAAPADVEGTDFEDAVTRLTALEIIAGYPDGTFKPGNTITRAEFAKIMTTALGVGEAAKYASGQTVFTDVAANHWASGYINVAADMKIINGYGDGNFGPEDKVTYAQAVTMIVRALGYEPKAAAMGGYPGGYLAIAAEKDITDDVNVVDTLAATRGDVAIMVDASLTVPMMVQKSWGQYPEYEEDENKTLITTKLGVDEIEGVVTEIPNTQSALDEDEIKVGNDKYALKTDVNVDSLLGVEVKVWADDDDIFFVDVQTDADDIKFDTAKDADGSEVTLVADDETYDWADDAKVYVNFEEVNEKDVKDNAYGYFVLNDKEEVAYANLFDFNEVAVGVVYEADGDVYKYVDADASEEEIELSDYKDGVTIYNEKMEVIDADEIDVNSAIFAWETSDELYLVVKNEVVQGKLERIKDSEIKVDGKTYDAADAGAVYSDDKFDNFDEYKKIADLDNLAGEAVKVVLDLNGDALLVYGDAETTSSTMYGVVTYTEMGSKPKATVYTKDGEEVDYTFEERSDATKLSDLEYFENDESGLEFGVMKFKLNSDGKIDSDYIDEDGDVTVIDLSETETLLKDADKNYVYVDADGNSGTTNDRTKYYISEDTVFMTALDSESGELDPKVIKYDDIYRSAINMTNDNSKVFVYGTAGKDADMIVFLEKDFEGYDDDYYYGVVTDSPWKDGDDYVVTIDVFGEGEKEYVVKTASHFPEAKVVKFHFNSDNEIVRDAVGTLDSDHDFDYDDGYLTGINGDTIKISSKAVIYELDEDGEVDKTIGASKVKSNNYKNLMYVLDEDDIIVAATVVDKDVDVEEEDQIEADGEIALVEYDSASDTTVRIKVNGKTEPYEVDKDSVLVLDKDDTDISGETLPVGTKVNFTTVRGTERIDIIKAVELDKTAPEATGDFTNSDAKVVVINFDEAMDEDTLVEGNFSSTAGGAITDFEVASNNKSVTITFTNDLTDDDTVVIAAAVTDAAGNAIEAAGRTLTK